MALLIFLSLFFATPAYAERSLDPSIEILFDTGNPKQSVAIVDRELLELGDIYDEHLKVHRFEKDALILISTRDGGVVRLSEGRRKAPGYVQDLGRYRFVVNQLEAIRQAQVDYERRYKKGYTPELETLLKHGYLADGFEDSEKGEYLYEIVRVGKTPRYAMKHENMSTFLASASPVNNEKGRLFFTMDHLGQVRYGATLDEAEWGPVWDYYAIESKPRIQNISLE